MHVAILSGHRAVPNPGMMGGSAGELGRNAIRRNDGRIEAGEAVEIVTPTGAGGEGGLPAGAPLPQLAGEGGAERRMGAGWGMARCGDASRNARPSPRTYVVAYLLSTPHPAFGHLVSGNCDRVDERAVAGATARRRT